MFIKKTKGGTKKNPIIYLQLVQSYRDHKGKPRHKVIMNLGREDEIMNTDRIDKIIKALEQLSRELIIIDKNKEFARNPKILGTILVIERIWKKLELDKKLEKVKSKYNIKYDLNKAVKLMVINRLISPGSKQNIMSWKEKINGEYEDVELHHIYRSLDILDENKEYLERELYKKSLSLFKPVINMVFYDLTSTYFESTDEDTFRRFGYSKDNKTDCVQVIIGLVLSKEGIPLGYDVFPGSEFEGSTVVKILNKLKRHYEIGKVIFVGDKGFMNRKVLNQIEGEEYEYIIAAKLMKTKKKYHEEILDRNKYRKISDGMYVYEMELEGRRLVLGYSEERANRDKKLRDILLEKLKKKLKSSGSSSVMKPKYKRYLNFGDNVEISEDKIKEVSKWDGYFGFYTNNYELSCEEVIKAYKLLWQVESSFRNLKSTLKLRPIYHWTPRRIKGHIMMCYISFYILRYIEMTLRNNGVDITGENAIDELNQIYSFELSNDRKKYIVRTEITGVKAKIFRALSVKIPKTVISESDLVVE